MLNGHDMAGRISRASCTTQRRRVRSPGGTTSVKLQLHSTQLDFIGVNMPPQIGRLYAPPDCLQTSSRFTLRGKLSAQRNSYMGLSDSDRLLMAAGRTSNTRPHAACGYLTRLRIPAMVSWAGWELPVHDVSCVALPHALPNPPSS